MKKANIIKTSIIGILLVFMSVNTIGCEVFPVKGNRKVVTEQRKVKPFNSIRSNGCVDIYISQGDSDKLNVEADENLIDLIVTKVKNNTLIVYAKKSIWDAKALNVYVTVRELNNIEINGSGDIKTESRINTDKLQFVVAGSGDLSLDVTADKLAGRMIGSGDVDISDTTELFDVSINGSGDLDVYNLQTQKCHLRLSGSGDVSISGNTRILNVEQISSGDVNLFKLYSEKCKINKCGSGDARINVSGDLDILSSGSGDVYFKGDPYIKSMNVSGSGDIIKVNR